jgi:[acyl-carrier-protein] S-malonyltransferase
MFEGVRRVPGFRSKYEIICEHTGVDVLRAHTDGSNDILNRNLVSSLMAILVSAVSLDTYLERLPPRISYFSGYSVGQWTAIYAANMITFDDLVRIVSTRAKFMNESVEKEPSGMSAVIGIDESILENLLADLRTEGLPVFISNYNCIGQYSIAGSLKALQIAEERINSLQPRKLIRLPVSGAWHCSILNAASAKFASFLETVTFGPPRLPIIDNVTGDWLPEGGPALKASLALHLTHPVLWHRGIKKLVAEGATTLREIGYGNMLTKFCFFIDRKIECRPC